MNAARPSTANVPAPATALLLLLALAACTGGAGSPIPSASAPSTEPTITQSQLPSQSPPAAPSESPTPSASSDPGDHDGFAWTEAATFSHPEASVVTDIAAWDAGFLAIGHAWANGFIHGPGEPLVWVSADGRTWSEADVDLGTTDVELRGILPLASGGAVIVGDVGSQAAMAGEGVVTAGAWRSADGQTWNAFELPSEIAAQPVKVASGPIGHVISTRTELWYSADAESWQLAHEVDEGVELRQPVAGTEGFVLPAIHVGEDRALVLASGDGTAWFEAEPPAYLVAVAALGGDWLAWASTVESPTISVYRSANGLEWSDVLNVNDLTPPDGPKSGLGMESGITEATLSGDGGIVVMTLNWNHCCAQLPVAVGVWTTTDGATWQQADLPADAHVSAVATDGEVVVAAGNIDRGDEAAFWVADR